MKRGDYKRLGVVLAVTCVLWFMLSMSDVKEFTNTYRVHYVGYDTNRFALVTATDSIQLSVYSNGFQALARNHRMKHRPLEISLSAAVREDDTNEVQHIALPLARHMDALRSQLELSRDNRLTLHTDGLNLSLAQRRRKAFVPRLTDVGFEFAEGFSLGGEPRLVPDTVWLYGSQTSLDRVGELHTRPAAITRIDTSAFHTLQLDTAWRRYSDLRISTSEVQVYVPVVASTERTFRVPIHFRCADTCIHARLYPDQVEVHCWLSTQDYADVNPSQFEASVTYDEANATPELRVTMDRFPAQVQIRHVEPMQVKYVVLK